MSQFASMIPGLLGFGGTGGAAGPVSSGPAINRSIVVNGASGGAVADLAQLLSVVQGPPANGGFTPRMRGDREYVSITADSGGFNVGGNTFLLLAIGGVVLFVLLRK